MLIAKINHKTLLCRSERTIYNNGRFERGIILLQHLARSMMIHVEKWRKGWAIVHLWPNALRMTKESICKMNPEESRCKSGKMHIPVYIFLKIKCASLHIMKLKLKYVVSLKLKNLFAKGTDKKSNGWTFNLLKQGYLNFWYWGIFRTKYSFD